MDFFEHQDVARRKTGRLVVLMALAVLAIIALVYGVVLAVIVIGQEKTGGALGGSVQDLPYLQMLGATAVGVLVVVGGGSLFKTSQLAGGGRVVAESLGGRPLDSDTTDPDERRLLNVVEEMAIASGSPVPSVYLLDNEEGINAFAAGWTIDDAVIGVTRGCVQQLTRDELQGVIAHEFSHILHGDMRINLRLVGIIFGILVISVIGATIMRSIAHGSRVRSRSNNKDSGGGVLAILAIGLALYLIGYVGVFFGKLIQAAVSRQREFLADASAVQYTRNPEGIAGALRRIGGLAYGSKLQTAHAVEHSHLFFGSAVTSWLGGAFATHPPLPDRIGRVLPSWDGSFLEPLPPRGDHPPEDRGPSAADRGRQTLRRVLTGAGHAGAAGFAGETSGVAIQPEHPGAAAAETAIEQIGETTPAHLLLAQQIIEDLPAVLRSAAHTSTGAQALVLALLMDRRDDGVRGQQLAYLQEQAAGPVAVLAGRLADAAASLPVEHRLPLLDLALPALVRLHPQVLDQLHAHVDALIEADERLDLFEWALRQVLWRHLMPVDPSGSRQKRRLDDVRGSVELLLSVLAHVGGREENGATDAFAAATAQMPGVMGATLDLLPRDTLSMARLTDAVDELAALRPMDQKPVIAACAAAIAADGRVTARENELMRAVAETLGVPVPPLLAGQRLI